MEWKPNKWLGMALCLFFTPPALGLFYVGAPVLALVFSAVCITAFLLALVSGFVSTYMPIVMLILVGGIPATYFLAARAVPIAHRPWYTRWYGLLGIFAAYALTIFMVRAFLFEPFKVPSMSMAPGVPKTSLLVVRKWGYGHYTNYGISLARRAITAPLASGDVIVFDNPKDPSQAWIKRLVGLPGDKVSYRDKRLVVNGVPANLRALDDYLNQDELRYDKRFEETTGAARYEILHHAERAPLNLEGTFPHKDACVIDGPWIACTVPAGHYFVLGDNRDNSVDSRMFGFVPASHVVGKVVVISRPVQ